MNSHETRCMFGVAFPSHVDAGGSGVGREQGVPPSLPSEEGTILNVLRTCTRKSRPESGVSEFNADRFNSLDDGPRCARSESPPPTHRTAHGRS